MEVNERAEQIAVAGSIASYTGQPVEIILWEASMAHMQWPQYSTLEHLIKARDMIARIRTSH